MRVYQFRHIRAEGQCSRGRAQIRLASSLAIRQTSCVADAQMIRRDAEATRAQAARTRWIARKETLRAHRAVERAREVCYAPLIWLERARTLGALGRGPVLTLVPEPRAPGRSPRSRHRRPAETPLPSASCGPGGSCSRRPGSPPSRSPRAPRRRSCAPRRLRRSRSPASPSRSSSRSGSRRSRGAFAQQRTLRSLATRRRLDPGRRPPATTRARSLPRSARSRPDRPRVPGARSAGATRSCSTGSPSSCRAARWRGSRACPASPGSTRASRYHALARPSPALIGAPRSGAPTSRPPGRA